MFSWFPLYFPIRNPIYVPKGATVEVHFWRNCNRTKVWYEWAVTSPDNSPIHNPGGRGHWIGLDRARRSGLPQIARPRWCHHTAVYAAAAATATGRRPHGFRGGGWSGCRWHGRRQQNRAFHQSDSGSRLFARIRPAVG